MEMIKIINLNCKKGGARNLLAERLEQAEMAGKCCFSVLLFQSSSE